MDIRIERINAYDDSRFSEKVLKQHGAFVINDTIPCEIEIVGNCEAVVHGGVQEYQDTVIEEFRFYAEHICKFYNEEQELIKEFEPVETFRIRIEEIQPSQFYVDEDKIEAVKTFITSPKDIIIPVMKENGKYISLDGHTRLAAAIELGYDEVIAFCTEAGDYIFDFVNEAKKRGIHTPYDLKKVPHEEYEVVWNQFCDEFFTEKNEFEK